MPRPLKVSPLRSGRGDGRGSHAALGRRLDDGDVARRLQIAQAEGDRVGADAAAISSMKDSLANWICGPTGSRRCAVRNGEARSSNGAIVSQASRLFAKP